MYQNFFSFLNLESRKLGHIYKLIIKTYLRSWTELGKLRATLTHLNPRSQDQQKMRCSDWLNVLTLPYRWGARMSPHWLAQLQGMDDSPDSSSVEMRPVHVAAVSRSGR